MSNDAKREAPAKPIMLARWVAALCHPQHVWSVLIEHNGVPYVQPCESEADASFMAGIHNEAVDEIERLRAIVAAADELDHAAAAVYDLENGAECDYSPYRELGKALEAYGATQPPAQEASK